MEEPRSRRPHQHQLQLLDLPTNLGKVVKKEDNYVFEILSSRFDTSVFPGILIITVGNVYPNLIENLPFGYVFIGNDLVLRCKL